MINNMTYLSRDGERCTLVAFAVGDRMGAQLVAADALRPVITPLLVRAYCDADADRH